MIAILSTLMIGLISILPLPTEEVNENVMQTRSEERRVGKEC